MAKRTREEDAISFPFLELPGDMMSIILKSFGLSHVFRFLILNKEYLLRFPYFIPLLYTDGYYAYLTRSGRINGICYRVVERYMAGCITSIRTVQDDGWRKLNGSVISKFYNVSHLRLEDTRNVSFKDLQQMTRLTSLDLTSCINPSSKPYIDIEVMTNLKKLDLSYCDCVSNSGLKKLTNLTSLYLCSNDVIRTEGIETLSLLTSLDLSGISSYVFNKDALRNMVNLKHLTILGNYHFGRMDGLVTLTLLHSCFNRIDYNTILPSNCEVSYIRQ